MENGSVVCVRYRCDSVCVSVWFMVESMWVLSVFML